MTKESGLSCESPLKRTPTNICKSHIFLVHLILMLRLNFIYGIRVKYLLIPTSLINTDLI